MLDLYIKKREIEIKKKKEKNEDIYENLCINNKKF